MGLRDRVEDDTRPEGSWVQGSSEPKMMLL